MDQTHIGYYYWQQPMMNSMPPVSRVQSRKQALPGPMRITIEGSRGAWYVLLKIPIRGVIAYPYTLGLVTTPHNALRDTTVPHQHYAPLIHTHHSRAVI